MVDEQDRLLIEAACQRLTLRYGRCIDLNDDEGVLSVFDENAVWNRPGQPPLRGHSEIAEFLRTRDRTTLMRHVMSNFQLDIRDAAHASGVSYWTGYVAVDHAPGTVALPASPFSIGEYHDDFVLEQGRWRIVGRTMKYIFRKS